MQLAMKTFFVGCLMYIAGGVLVLFALLSLMVLSVYTQLVRR